VTQLTIHTPTCLLLEIPKVSLCSLLSRTFLWFPQPPSGVFFCDVVPPPKSLCASSPDAIRGLGFAIAFFSEAVFYLFGVTLLFDDMLSPHPFLCAEPGFLEDFHLLTAFGTADGNDLLPSPFGECHLILFSFSAVLQFCLFPSSVVRAGTSFF